MPIYAYRCADCGLTKDVLQKLSDPVLTDCPSCGKPAFAKQVTAAGFQLKGSGWYVTDFRGGNNAAAKPEAKPDAGTAAAGGDGAAAPKTEAPAAAASSASTSASASSSTSAAASPSAGH